MHELKPFGNHEGKYVSSQLSVIWAINRLLITLADEEEINEELMFDPDKY